MVPSEKTDPVAVCLDADVLIAGLLSRRGASHAILILGEIGLLQTVLPETAVEEVRRNLAAKPRLLVTHNVRHFRSGEGVRVIRPRTFLEETRAWMGSFGSKEAGR